jgi:catechol 2,3-dioxygenase-like lactoylglutathione lyase family enzyme
VSNLATIEAKAFVPARDFALSKRFYQDLGFDLAWSDDDLAYLRHGNSSFLLQNFYNAAHAGNFMMHLLVENVDAWWRHVEAQGIAAKYVLWRIGENISLTSSRVRGEVERSEGEGQH